MASKASYLLFLALWFYSCGRVGPQDRILAPPYQTRAADIERLTAQADEGLLAEGDFWVLAQLNFEVGDTTKAWQAFDKAQSFGWDSAYLDLGAHLYAWQKDYTKALTLADAYQQKYGQQWDLQVAMATWLLADGDGRNALQLINEALQVYPSYGPYQLIKGMVLLTALQDTLQAENWLNKAAKQEKGLGKATLYLLDLYRSTGRSAAAKKQLLHFVQQQTNTHMIWPRLKALYEQEGKADSVMWVLHRWLQASTTPVVQNQLADYHRKQGNWDSATYYANLILNVDSTYKEAYRIHARVADAQYRYSSATLWYTQLLGLDSTDQIAQSELANVQRKVAYLRRLRAQQDTTQTR